MSGIAILALITMVTGGLVGLIYMVQIRADRKKNPQHGSMVPPAIMALLCLVPGLNVIPVFVILLLFSGEGFLAALGFKEKK
jgi:O-antigen/teichoic acid export membrane protein